MFPDPAALETIHVLAGFVDLQGYVDANIYAVCPLQRFFRFLMKTIVGKHVSLEDCQSSAYS